MNTNISVCDRIFVVVAPTSKNKKVTQPNPKIPKYPDIMESLLFHTRIDQAKQYFKNLEAHTRNFLMVSKKPTNYENTFNNRYGSSNRYGSNTGKRNSVQQSTIRSFLASTTSSLNPMQQSVKPSIIINPLKKYLAPVVTTILSIAISPEMYNFKDDQEFKTMFSIEISKIRKLLIPPNYRYPCYLNEKGLLWSPENEMFGIYPNYETCSKLKCFFEYNKNFTDPTCYADTTRMYYWNKYKVSSNIPSEIIAQFVNEKIAHLPDSQKLDEFLSLKRQIQAKESSIKFMSKSMMTPMMEYAVRTQLQALKKQVLRFPRRYLVVKLNSEKEHQIKYTQEQQRCSRADLNNFQTKSVMKPCLDNFSTFRNISKCHDLGCCFQANWFNDPLNQNNVLCFKQKTYEDKCSEALNGHDESKRYCPSLYKYKFNVKARHQVQQACYRAKCCFVRSEWEKHKDEANPRKNSNQWCYYM